MSKNNIIVEILEKHDINGFDKQGGTDKATDHSYDIYYSEFLKPLFNKKINIMEIGVQYGGSALLFNDLFPLSNMVFIDNENVVHNKILKLMDKSRYELIIDDAFSLNTIEKLQKKYELGFDLIIEDGPHTIESQIFTIEHYTKLLKPNGILIIEDIQNYEYCDKIIESLDKSKINSVEIVDLRNNKNRYDDILIVVKK